jgi:hypothetical protein
MEKRHNGRHSVQHKKSPLGEGGEARCPIAMAYRGSRQGSWIRRPAR